MLQTKLLYHQDDNKHFIFEHCWPILQNNIRWQDVTPTNTVKSRIHTPFSPNSTTDSPMDNCISLEDDTSPSVDKLQLLVRAMALQGGKGRWVGKLQKNYFGKIKSLKPKAKK